MPSRIQTLNELSKFIFLNQSERKKFHYLHHKSGQEIEPSFIRAKRKNNQNENCETIARIRPLD